MGSDPPVETGTTAGDPGDVGEVVRFDVVPHGEDARVVHVVGEIDTLTAPVLRAQLDEHLPAVQLLVLDMSQVTFLGSAGLAVLVAAKDDADRRRNRLRLVCGSRIVTRALEATGLLTLFDVADTVPEALKPEA
jgi:anti-sigma B factor antagonist